MPGNLAAGPFKSTNCGRIIYKIIRPFRIKPINGNHNLILFILLTLMHQYTDNMIKKPEAMLIFKSDR